ncbi:MFS transporter [Microlunatus speluncae]|uniref:MFS transporter n=1 Tax=Microlunatus speluncae TaxID=2594267 RepID=UPI00126684A8|nr:MFS transporter [Microlunatus speluncae]
MTLLVLLLCVFSITTGEFVISGILPAVAADLGVTPGAAGLLVSAYAIGMIIGGPVLTALTAALPRKPLLLALLAVAVIGNLGSALAPDYEILLAARLITALVTSTFFAHAVVVAVRSGSPERAASTVARLAFGMSLAMIIGAPLGTMIGQTWGWRWTFGAIALGCLLGLILVAAMINAPAEPRSSARSELRALGARPVLAALLITAVGNIGALAVFTYLAPLLTGVAGLAAGQVPLLLLGYGLGGTVGNLLGGRLADRAPRPAVPVLLAGLAGLLVIAWAVADRLLPAGIAVVGIGLLAFAVIPGLQARVLSAAAAAPTLAMAVNASGYQVAAAVAGWLGGMIVDSAAGPRPLYLVAAAVTAIGVLLAAVLRSHPAPRPNELEVAEG